MDTVIHFLSREKVTNNLSREKTKKAIIYDSFLIARCTP
jgi:hypothetical protein